jgi:hypothetical protein
VRVEARRRPAKIPCPQCKSRASTRQKIEHCSIFPASTRVIVSANPFPVCANSALTHVIASRRAQSECAFKLCQHTTRRMRIQLPSSSNKLQRVLTAHAPVDGRAVTNATRVVDRVMGCIHGPIVGSTPPICQSE